MSYQWRWGWGSPPLNLGEREVLEMGEPSFPLFHPIGRRQPSFLPVPVHSGIWTPINVWKDSSENIPFVEAAVVEENKQREKQQLEKKRKKENESGDNPSKKSKLKAVLQGNLLSYSMKMVYPLG